MPKFTPPKPKHQIAPPPPEVLLPEKVLSAMVSGPWLPDGPTDLCVICRESGPRDGQCAKVLDAAAQITAAMTDRQVIQVERGS